MTKLKNLWEKIKASFSGRKFRSGAYASVLSAVVIAIILVVNLIVSDMDIEIDLTANSKFSITDETKEILKGLKDDITIYYIVEQGSEVDEFEKVAKQYDKFSDKVKLVYKDPVLYPQFGSDLVDEEIAKNSFIVVNNTNNKAKYVDPDDMVIKDFNYYTYTSSTSIDTEGELTSAILYVTSEDVPNLYAVEGHQEAEMSDSFSEAVKKMNVNIQTLSTLTAENIPEDCDILYINSPKIDFSDEEAKMIKDYLAAGGNAIITVNYMASGMKNLKSILEYYGINIIDGLVVETDADMVNPRNPFYLLPNIESHDITSKAVEKSLYALMPEASGLVKAETTRSTLTITPLLTTSEASYAKTSLPIQTVYKEDGDVDGPFYVGVLATDTYEGTTSTCWYFHRNILSPMKPRYMPMDIY